MANQHTATLIPEESELNRLYHEEGLSQIEVGIIYNVTQKVVFGWFKKLGILSRVAAKRNQKGVNNSSWKGAKVTYAACHYRVESIYGKPMQCTECGTTDPHKSYDWANLSGDYTNPEDYQRMCRSCHRKYDKDRKGSSKHIPKRAK